MEGAYINIYNKQKDIFSSYKNDFSILSQKDRKRKLYKIELLEDLKILIYILFSNINEEDLRFQESQFTLLNDFQLEMKRLELNSKKSRF